MFTRIQIHMYILIYLIAFALSVFITPSLAANENTTPPCYEAPTSTKSLDGDNAEYFKVLEQLQQLPSGAVAIPESSVAEQKEILKLLGTEETKKLFDGEPKVGDKCIETPNGEGASHMYKGNFSNSGNTEYLFLVRSSSDTILGVYKLIDKHLERLSFDDIVIKNLFPDGDMSRFHMNIAKPFAYVEDNQTYLRFMDFPGGHLDYDISKLAIFTYLWEGEHFTLVATNKGNDKGDDLKSITQTKFDKPKETKVFDLGPSPYAPSKRIKLSCYIYPSFSIQELDEGEVGTKISVHNKASNDVKNDLCQQNLKGKELATPNTGGYLLGVVGNYVFVASADTFGDMSKLIISNALTGAKVLDIPYNANKPLEITHAADKVSLTYYRPLKASCVPSSADPNCWQQILKNNNVDEKVKISPPDCQKVIRDYPDILKDPEPSIQITVKMNVEDIDNPKITYLNGDSTCTASP